MSKEDILLEIISEKQIEELKVIECGKEKNNIMNPNILESLLVNTDLTEKKILKKLMNIISKNLNSLNKNEEINLNTLLKLICVFKLILTNIQLKNHENEEVNNFKNNSIDILDRIIKRKNKNLETIQNIKYELNNFYNTNLKLKTTIYKEFLLAFEQKNIDRVYCLIKNNPEIIYYKYEETNDTLIEAMLKNALVKFSHEKTISMDIYFMSRVLKIINMKTYRGTDKLIRIINKFEKKLKDSRKKLIIEELISIVEDNDKKLTLEEVKKKYDIKDQDFNRYVRLFLKNENFENSKNAITIDPSSDSFKDDAISASKDQDGNYILGIHITDVGSFMLDNHMLLNYISKKFKTIYLPKQSIEMMPSKLANLIFSLEEGTTKKCISLYITINENGEIIDYQIKNDEVNIIKNLTYSETDIILNSKEDNELYDYVMLIKELSSVIKEKNKAKEGYRIIKDLLGKNQIYYNNSSHSIVEECMITYNSYLASNIFDKSNIPFIYRVHEKPSNQIILEKIQTINENTKKVEDEMIQIFKEYYPRSKYSSENIGHYGLDKISYSHITSAGRRYPDIINQMIYHQFVFNQPKLKDIKKFDNIDEIAKYFNYMEEKIKYFEAEACESIRNENRRLVFKK